MKISGKMSYVGELLSALMGPAVNLALAGMLCRFSWGSTLAGINLVLALFNLLPIGVLDGGRAVRCLFCMTLGADIGELAAGGLSRLAALWLCLAGMQVWQTGGNLTLLLTMGWLIQELGGKRGEKRKKKREIGLAKGRRNKYNI